MLKEILKIIKYLIMLYFSGNEIYLFILQFKNLKKKLNYINIYKI